MTRPDGGRPAVDYTTTAPPPADTPVIDCRCGARYRDHPDSHTAHQKVHGHMPIRKPAPGPALNERGERA